MRRTVLLAGMLACLTGCLPIELDVSKDGRILIPRQEGFFILNPTTGQVTKVAKATHGNPVFARFSDKSNVKGNILIVSESSNNMQFQTLNPTTEQAQQVYSASNCTYITVSPAGNRFAVARVADSSSGGFKQNLPELIVVDKPGSAKKIASNVSSLHRWSADGKSLVTIQLKSKDEKSDNYSGELVRLDPASGQATALCKIAGPDGLFFDLSPDGKTILFTAAAAAATTETITVPEKSKKLSLYRLDLTSGKVQLLRNNIHYAIFSPDGKQVLIGMEGNDNLLTLQVVDAGFTRIVTLAEDAAAQAAAGMGPPTYIYPGWVNNTTVHYLARRSVYGTAGKNLMLMISSADGKNTRCLQAAIDTAATK